jgi:hypothetical protein
VNNQNFRAAWRAFVVAASIATGLICSAATFTGVGTGAIPDSPSGIGTTPGAPLTITFTASGLTAATITDIRVAITFGTAHLWGGDLTATLVSPGDLVSFPIFGRIGAGAAGSAGTGDDWAANTTYEFVDPTLSANNIWATIANGTLSYIPGGTYATTQVGGGSVVSPAPTTNFLGAFSGLTQSQLNGVWKLVITDNSVDDTGSISAASLTLQQAAPSLQYSFGPTSLFWAPREIGAVEPALPIVIFAPSSNTQTVGFNVSNCSIGGPNQNEFRLISGNTTVTPGQTAEMYVAFRRSGNGTRLAALSCTPSPPGALPGPMVVALEAGAISPPPNCYDVDGDGNMNALVDGLFLTRLQLGFSPSAAANGLAFQPPRNTLKRVMGYLVNSCGYPNPVAVP